MFLSRTARAPILRALATPRTAIPARRFKSDYGSGEQYDGKNPSEHIEHPGPPPPSAAQGKGGSKQQQSSESKQPSSGKSKSSEGAEPKILNESPPKEGEEPNDVAEHNKDVSRRADQAHEKVNEEQVEKDKVGKGFWKGE